MGDLTNWEEYRIMGKMVLVNVKVRFPILALRETWNLTEEWLNTYRETGE